MTDWQSLGCYGRSIDYACYDESSNFYPVSGPNMCATEVMERYREWADMQRANRNAIYEKALRSINPPVYGKSPGMTALESIDLYKYAYAKYFGSEDLAKYFQPKWDDRVFKFYNQQQEDNMSNTVLERTEVNLKQHQANVAMLVQRRERAAHDLKIIDADLKSARASIRDHELAIKKLGKK